MWSYHRAFRHRPIDDDSTDDDGSLLLPEGGEPRHETEWTDGNQCTKCGSRGFFEKRDDIGYAECHKCGERYYREPPIRTVSTPENQGVRKIYKKREVVLLPCMYEGCTEIVQTTTGVKSVLCEEHKRITKREKNREYRRARKQQKNETRRVA